MISLLRNTTYYVPPKRIDTPPQGGGVSIEERNTQYLVVMNITTYYCTIITNYFIIT